MPRDSKTETIVLPEAIVQNAPPTAVVIVAAAAAAAAVVVAVMASVDAAVAAAWATPLAVEVVATGSLRRRRRGRNNPHHSHQTVLQRPCHSRRAAVDAEFGEEIACVRAGGVDANLEAVGNFFGGEAFDEKLQQVVFTWR